MLINLIIAAILGVLVGMADPTLGILAALITFLIGIVFIKAVK